ncbi:MAG: hypothetical protein H7A33_05275 [Deltaproteobacteria bacterium]|nr:hypothetical protein [Deltaproteobacteria bacterium]
MSLKLGEWRVYSTQNFTVRYDNDPMPQWNAVLGLQTPSLLKDRVVLSLQVMNTFVYGLMFCQQLRQLFPDATSNIYR